MVSILFSAFSFIYAQQQEIMSIANNCTGPAMCKNYQASCLSVSNQLALIFRLKYFFKIFLLISILYGPSKNARTAWHPSFLHFLLFQTTLSFFTFQIGIGISFGISFGITSALNKNYCKAMHE